MANERGKTRPAKTQGVDVSKSEVLAAAVANPSDAMTGVMEFDKKTSAEEPLNQTDRQTLQAIAHGGEAFRNSYDSRPADGDTEAPTDQRRTEFVPDVGNDRGDSGSLVASALASRKKPRAKRQGF